MDARTATLAQVRAARALGLHLPRRGPAGHFHAGHSGNPTGRRRGIVPKQNPPTAIVREYHARLAAIVARYWAALGPLRDALPGLLESASRDRRDADEAQTIRDLVARARNSMAGSVTQRDVEALAREYAAKTSAHQRLELARQTRAVLGVDVLAGDRKLPGIIDAFAAQNAALIRNIGDKLAHDVEVAAIDAVQRGRLASDLADDLEDRLGFAEGRAKAIARDQIGKLNGDIDQARQRDLGVTSFIWRTVHDERVRGDPGGLYPKAKTSHYALDAKRFRYDDPPLNDDGEPILPADEPNCRCRAEPVLDDLLGDDEDAGSE